uniref:Uncharacterized protein n=1 Tax=Arundo donax TaxID=35708 RepID=A0A0A9EZS1_ARUDO
MDDIKYVQMI